MGMNREERIEHLKSSCSPCRLCPQKCGVDRLNGEMGTCRTGYYPRVGAYGAVFSEEPCISGTKGSGAILFTGCNMQCIYCLNHTMSQRSGGAVMTPHQLANLFFRMRDTGVHNINLISPTHSAASIAEAIAIARDRGMELPIIYNTGGYESPDTIRWLDGLVDIYLTDVKYGFDALGSRLSGAPDYTFYASASLAEMYRQAGRLKVENGLAVKGVLVRHLILPGYGDSTDEALKLVKHTVGREIDMHLMRSYEPAWRAAKDPKLNTQLSEIEYRIAVDRAKTLGFTLI